MRWSAWLKGEEFDLEDLPGLFPGDPAVVKNGADYWLESTTFDVLTTASEVQAEAGRLLALINGAASIANSSYRPVQLGARFRDPQGIHQVLVADTIEARGKVSAVVITGGSRAPQAPAPGPSDFVAVAEKDAAVSAALAILSRRDIDWYDVYKIYEIVVNDVGRRQVIAHGWATDRELDALTASANHPGVSGNAARHAVQRGGTPTRTMTLSDARSLVRELVKKWVLAKV